MKTIIFLFSALAIAAQAQVYTPTGWQMVGTTLGTNTAYVVVPRNTKLTTLQFWCDNKLAKLKLLYPDTAYTISNNMAAGAGSNINCTADIFTISKGEKVILWSQTNNVYQVATVLSNFAWNIRLSNETFGAYATNVHPIGAGDVLYSTTEYTIAPTATDAAGEPIPTTWSGLNMVVTPWAKPLAYHMYLADGAGNELSNIYVNAWGTR